MCKNEGFVALAITCHPFLGWILHCCSAVTSVLFHMWLLRKTDLQQDSFDSLTAYWTQTSTKLAGNVRVLVPFQLFNSLQWRSPQHRSWRPDVFWPVNANLPHLPHQHTSTPSRIPLLGISTLFPAFHHTSTFTCTVTCSKLRFCHHRIQR